MKGIYEENDEEKGKEKKKKRKEKTRKLCDKKNRQKSKYLHHTTYKEIIMIFTKLSLVRYKATSVENSAMIKIIRVVIIFQIIYLIIVSRHDAQLWLL